jgi:hypothetical protein
MEGMTAPVPEPEPAHRILVVGADGAPMDVQEAPEDQDGRAADMVEQPAKVMRIGTMVKQLLEEVRAAPLDDASRTRLREIHENSIKELSDGLSPELRDELARLSLPFGENTVPSDAELRIAQAQLVGWLEGLFHGIQAAMVAQQMAIQAQVSEQQRRRALPPGAADHGFASGGSGPYL